MGRLGRQDQTSYVSTYRTLGDERQSEAINLCVGSLSKSWDLHVVETPLDEGGRIGLRLLNFETRAYLYIAVDSRLEVYERMLAVLHELGHLALHFDELARAGATYQSICMCPSLERRIAEFTKGREGQRLRTLREMEADIFATCWIVPRHLDSLRTGREVARTVSGLDPLTEKYILLRDAFADSDHRTIPRCALASFVRIARAEADSVHAQEYAVSGSLWQRLSWAVFNRHVLGRQVGKERARLTRKYFNLFPDPLSLLSIATRTDVGSVGRTLVASTWLNRVTAGDLGEKLDGVNWEPVLVSEKDSSPPYYIPICPVPSVNPRDSQLAWRHMMKPPHSPAKMLDSWIDVAGYEGAGLLVFGRNPAERILEGAR